VVPVRVEGGAPKDQKVIIWTACWRQKGRFKNGELRNDHEDVRAVVLGRLRRGGIPGALWSDVRDPQRSVATAARWLTVKRNPSGGGGRRQGSWQYAAEQMQRVRTRKEEDARERR